MPRRAVPPEQWHWAHEYQLRLRLAGSERGERAWVTLLHPAREQQWPHCNHEVTLKQTSTLNPDLQQDQNQACCLDFPGRGAHLVFAKFLKPLLFPRSRESVDRMSGSWLATFLTPFHNVCASVKGLSQTKHKGCTALASKYRVFFLFFFFFPSTIECGNV